MQSTGGRLRGQGKTKQGNLWEWIQSKTERHIYIGGSGIVNIYYTDYIRDKITVGVQESPALWCVLKGLDKG